MNASWRICQIIKMHKIKGLFALDLTEHSTDVSANPTGSHEGLEIRLWELCSYDSGLCEQTSCYRFSMTLLPNALKQIKIYLYKYEGLLY